ncbi:hypothetical protein E0500_042195 [Streptomyces sp. KM273126]|nr:hypothetical protein [Streptomyces sp. KM273126]MBA2813752.1 hypothetical protein [Streptomyces sp. KM273126]
MRPTLQPKLTARATYTVPIERTVPHLLPEAGHFTQMPQVPATGYLVGLVEWACMQALDGHLDESERTLGVEVDAPESRGFHLHSLLDQLQQVREPVAVQAQMIDADRGQRRQGARHIGKRPRVDVELAVPPGNVVDTACETVQFVQRRRPASAHIEADSPHTRGVEIGDLLVRDGGRHLRDPDIGEAQPGQGVE